MNHSSQVDLVRREILVFYNTLLNKCDPVFTRPARHLDDYKLYTVSMHGDVSVTSMTLIEITFAFVFILSK